MGAKKSFQTSHSLFKPLRPTGASSCLKTISCSRFERSAVKSYVKTGSTNPLLFLTRSTRPDSLLFIGKFGEQSDF
jgi:hypothetical protein